MALLVALDKVKRLGRIRDSADDRLLTEMIEAATAKIQQITSRRLFQSTQLEVRDGHGRARMMLRERPVTVVSSVKVNGLAIPARSVVGQSGYVFDRHGLVLIGHRFETGVANVEVAYTGGFEQIPEDLQQACAEVVLERYKGIDRLGISSKTLAGETIAFLDGALPETAKRVIDQYTSVVAP